MSTRPRRLEDLRASDQDPRAARRARADEKSGRRRQAERARAGDDEHRDRCREGEGGAGAGPSQNASVASGERDHDRDEDGRDPVGQPLHGRLARLRLRDEPRDLGESGVGADAARANDEPTADVDRRAEDLVTRLHLDRHALAREQDRSTAELPSSTTPSVAIFSPGRTTKRSPTTQRSTGTRRSRPSASSRPTSLAPELEQCPERSSRTSFRASLEVPTGEDEGRHDGRDLEVDLLGGSAAVEDELETHAHARLPGAEEDEGDDRPAPRGEHADRDEGVHRRGAVLQVLPGSTVERPRAPERDRRREQQGEPLPVLELERLEHREQEHGERQRSRDDETPSERRGRIAFRAGLGRVGARPARAW